MPEIIWLYNGGDKGYHVLVDGKPVYFTPDKRECDLFIAELKGRLKMDAKRYEWKNGFRMPILEDSPTPAKQIRDARKELEDEVRESCLRFVERTGLAVTGISVEFMETTAFGGGFDTQLQSVRVVVEDV